MGNGALSPTNSQDSYDEEAGGSTYNASSGSSPKSADKQMKGRGIQNPVQPKKKKDDVFHPELFSDLDHFAARELVSRNILESTYQELAQHLTQNAYSDLEKVRVLFRWLTGVQLQNLVQEAGNDLPPPDSPMEGLLEIHWKMGNHAHFFARLARCAGIDCEIITGINKNANFVVGQPLNDEMLAAQWNAVKIDGETFLLDVFWASTCLEDGQQMTDWTHLWNLFDEGNQRISQHEFNPDMHLRTKHQINEFFFLTDPEKFIVTHLPENDKWQLLPKPLSREEFALQPFIRERFYDMKLTLPSKQQSCTIRAKNGQATYTLEADRADPKIVFRWKLIRSADGKGQQLNVTSSYDRYVFYIKKPASVDFWVVFPEAGTYLLDLYGQVGTGEHFAQVCSLCFLVDEASNAADPLPDLPDCGWGLRSFAASDHELTPLFEDSPYLEAENGSLELRFKVPNHKLIGFSLRHNTIEDVVLRKHALVIRRDEVVSVQMRLPGKGSYALGIYVGEVTGTSMSNVANYMVNCVTAGLNTKAFPLLYNGSLGPEPMMVKKFGISVENENYLLKSNDGTVQLTFEIDDPKSVDLLSELQMNNVDSSKLSSYLHPFKESSSVTFELQLPVQGEYGLNVFARKMGIDYQIFHVYSYIIVAESGTGAPVKPPEQPIATESIFTADDIADIRVTQSKGALVSVAKKNSQNRFIDNQITAKKEGEITVYEVDLPTTGEYVVVVYRLKGGNLVARQVAQMVRLEPLQGDTRPMAMMFPDRRLNKLERKKRKSMSLGLNHEAFRLQLRAAVASQNVSLLQWAINQCEMNYIPEKNGELRKSKKILDFMMCNQDLTTAMQIRHLGKLREAVEAAERREFEKILSLKIAMAKRIIEELQHLDNIKAQIECLERKQILAEAEQSGGHVVIHRVMYAACDLLGMELNSLQDWSNMQKIIQQKDKMSLKRLVAKCSLDRVDIVSAFRAKNSIGSLELEEIKAKSAGAALFYLWTLSMIEEVESHFIQSGGDRHQAEGQAMKTQVRLNTDVNHQNEQGDEDSRENVIKMRKEMQKKLQKKDSLTDQLQVVKPD